jgi:hypothetical protein
MRKHNRLHRKLKLLALYLKDNHHQSNHELSSVRFDARSFEEVFKMISHLFLGHRVRFQSKFGNANSIFIKESQTALEGYLHTPEVKEDEDS